MNKFQKAIISGFTPVPCINKKPIIYWKPLMTKPPTLKEAADFVGDVAIICGGESKLTCIDFDEKNGQCFDNWILDVQIINPELLSKLYIETTPSGGYHACYRSDNTMRNKKLACNESGVAMIETRGEGGLFCCSPSTGYKIYYGKLSDLELLSNDEVNTLLAVAESFNQYEKEEYVPMSPVEVTGDTVLNRYDSVANPVPLLLKHGWTVLYSRGDKAYLCRPEKKGSLSATWNVIPNRFYCFSTSTVFESEHVYKPSAVYAILEHNGDYRSACKALAEQEKQQTIKPKD